MTLTDCVYVWSLGVEDGEAGLLEHEYEVTFEVSGCFWRGNFESPPEYPEVEWVSCYDTCADVPGFHDPNKLVKVDLREHFALLGVDVDAVEARLLESTGDDLRY